MCVCVRWQRDKKERKKERKEKKTHLHRISSDIQHERSKKKIIGVDTYRTKAHIVVPGRISSLFRGKKG